MFELLKRPEYDHTKKDILDALKLDKKFLIDNMVYIENRVKKFNTLSETILFLSNMPLKRRLAYNFVTYQTLNQIMKGESIIMNSKDKGEYIG